MKRPALLSSPVVDLGSGLDVAAAVALAFTAPVRDATVAVVELGLPHLGRADVVILEGRGLIQIVEVKTSLSDLRRDRKWPTYLSFADHVLFAVPKGMVTVEDFVKIAGKREPGYMPALLEVDEAAHVHIARGLVNRRKHRVPDRSRLEMYWRVARRAADPSYRPPWNRLFQPVGSRTDKYWYGTAYCGEPDGQFAATGAPRDGDSTC